MSALMFRSCAGAKMSRMKLLLISIVGVMAAAAFAQQSPAPARRSPEQIFEFLDKDKNGTLSEAEFGALKDKMPSLRDRPDAISVKHDKPKSAAKRCVRAIARSIRASRCGGLLG